MFVERRARKEQLQLGQLGAEEARLVSEVGGNLVAVDSLGEVVNLEVVDEGGEELR